MSKTKSQVWAELKELVGDPSPLKWQSKKEDMVKAIKRITKEREEERKRRTIGTVPKAAPGRPSFKREGPSARSIQTKIKSVAQQAAEAAIGRQKKSEQRRKGIRAALEAAEVGLRRRSTFNVHITANYTFPLTENTDITFSTKAFTEGEVKQSINELRVKWEADQNGLVNGKSNWKFKNYVSINIVEVTPNMLANIPMLGARWSYSLLGDIDKINTNKGECVTDYLEYEFLRYKRYFKYMNKKKIISLLGGIRKGYTVNDILGLARTSKYITVHALDPLLEVFAHHQAEENTRINLCFIVSNNHCYPIIDKTFKTKIIRSKHLDLGEVKFDIVYHKHKYIENSDDVIDKKEGVFLVNENDLSSVAQRVMENTGNIITGMRFNHSNLVAFEHPNGGIIESAPDYELRKETLSTIHKEFPIDEFKFHNQTWTNIGSTLFKYKYDDLHKSYLSPEVRQIYDKYPMRPYIKLVEPKVWNLITEDNPVEAGFDISKDYTDVLLNNEHDFPIFTPFDKVTKFSEDEPRKLGEYYINRRFTLGDSKIVQDKGFYPFNLTKFCYDNGWINGDDITYYIKATLSLPKDHFVEFINYCYSLGYNSDGSKSTAVGKRLVNYFTGFLNKKFNTSVAGCITDSYEMACGTFCNQTEKGRNCFISKVKDLFIIRSTKKTPSIGTSSPIYRQIIAGGIINLYKMSQKVTNEKSIIVSYKVDSIMVINPDPSLVLKEEAGIGDIRKEEWNVGGKEISIDSREDYIHRDKLSWDTPEKRDLTHGSYLIDGMSGSGKSTVLAKLTKKEEKYIVLCFTNKACSVLRRKGVKNVQTFDSIFYRFGKVSYDYGVSCLTKYDNIFVDEYSMVPWRQISMLGKVKEINSNVNIRFFGDNDQLPPVEENSPPRTKENTYRLYDYKKSYFIKKLCGTLYVMDYIQGCGRYDDKLHKVVRGILDDGKLNGCEGKKLEECFTNLCYTNKKRLEINKACMSRYCSMYGTQKGSSDSFELFTGEYTKKKTTTKKEWVKGMPVICNINSDKNKCYKSEMFKIKSITDKRVTIDNGTKFDMSYFTEHFDSGFCITVHRAQGDELEEYAIHEVWKMNREMVYTAIGRGKTLDKIYFNYTSNFFPKEKIYRGTVVIEGKPAKIETPIESKKKKQEKKKIQICEDLHLVDEAHKKQYKIHEGKSLYYIKFQKDGKQTKRSVRFGKKTTKKEALKKIMKVREELIK